MSVSELKHPQSSNSLPAQKQDVLPTLFGDGYGLYEVRKGSFVVSFLLNTAILALLIWIGTWTASHTPEIKQVVGLSVDISPYALPPSKTESGGGGGGGSHDKIAASKGAPPKAARDQIAPPSAVIKVDPKLAVTPTVVAPPEMKFTPAPMGDPLAKMVTPIPSNGTGLGGGIGSGSGGGVGSGSGPGLGPGHGGGVGGGAYRVGGGVKPPTLVYKVEPEYSEEGRKNKMMGNVLLRVIVGADGKIRDLTVLRSLGMGLDEKAIAAVRQWRFEPGTKDGLPVPVEVSVEVNFHLY